MVYLILSSTLKSKRSSIIGAGGPRDTAIRSNLVHPRVIFDTFTEVELPTNCKKTGIPVVVLSYGKVERSTKDLHQSIRLISDVTVNERAEVIDIINNYLDDISQRVSTSITSSPTIYIGAGVGDNKASSTAATTS